MPIRHGRNATTKWSANKNLGSRCRMAPVGTHETLLAYLVRRLLENGANTSFVNQIVDEHISLDERIRSPFRNH